VTVRAGYFERLPGTGYQFFERFSALLADEFIDRRRRGMNNGAHFFLLKRIWISRWVNLITKEEVKCPKDGITFEHKHTFVYD